MKPTFVAIALTACAVVSGVSAFGCKPDEVKGWMASCDSLVNISQIRCDNKGCHTALHRLVEQETIDCYVESVLGSASDLAKYKMLDDFCHGEGPDPTELSVASPSTNQTATATDSGSSNGSAVAAVVTTDKPASVPTTAPAAVPSPAPSSAASSSIASPAVVSAAIVLSVLSAAL